MLLRSGTNQDHMQQENSAKYMKYYSVLISYIDSILFLLFSALI